MKESYLRIAKTVIIFAIFLVSPTFVFAKVVITEIMYDAEGADTDREWVEIYNNSDDEVNLAGWKFFDGANHVLNEPPKNGGRGSLVLAGNSYAIFASDAVKFISEIGGAGVSVVDTVMSLSNVGATLKLFDVDGKEVDSVTYIKEAGATGDGQSLSRTGTKLTAGSVTAGTGTQAITSTETTSTQTSSSQQSASSNTATSKVPLTEFIEPKIFADAGEDRIALVGADTIFRGVAYGIKKEPIRNIRFIWNWGDGSVSEGETVMHVFYYPGDYAVFLYTSSGEYTATDKIVVKAIPSPLSISGVLYGSDSAIKIKNDSSSDLDLSFWHIQSGTSNWSVPKNTFILKKTEVTLSSKRTYLNLIEGQSVKLLYPNGEVAYEYSKNVLPANVVKNPVVAKKTVNTESISANPKVLGALAVASQVNELATSADQSVITADSLANDNPQSNSKGGGVASVFVGTGILKWLMVLVGFVGLIIFFLFYVKAVVPNEPIVATKPQEKPEDSGLEFIAEEFEIIEETDNLPL